MALHNVDYAATLRSTANSNRGPSAEIWKDCPVLGLLEGSVEGMYFFDDFLSFPKTAGTTEGNLGQYTQFGSAGSVITAGTGQGGEIVITEATDDEGINLRTLTTPYKIARGCKKLWFEARLKLLNITDSKAGVFIGFMENAAGSATVPIAADGTLADQNLVGFHHVEGDGDKFDTVYKANGVAAVTVQADAVPVVADTYVKLGMVFDPLQDKAGTNRLVFYYDGIRLATSKEIPSAAGTDFPNDVGLGLIVAQLLAASSSFTTTLDWWRCAQLL